jgi:hypothetical protein
MSVKSFAEAVKEGITRYTRAFGIEQAEEEEAQFAPMAVSTEVIGEDPTTKAPAVGGGSVPLLSSVVSSSTVPLGEVSGSVASALAEQRAPVITATLIGNTVAKKPTGWAAGPSTVVAVIMQDATGGRTFSWEGVTWPAGGPHINMAPNARSVLVLETTNGGTTVFGTEEPALGLLNAVLVPPSGASFTTGEDAAALNAALAANARVMISGDYYVGASVNIPSNTTLILCNARIHLQNKAQMTVLRNTNWETGNKNINLICIGEAWIDGNAAEQTHELTATKGCGVVFGFVENLTQIGTLKIGPCNKSAFYLAGSTTSGQSTNINLDHILLNQNGVTENQDGVDIAYNTTHVNIRKISGVTGDDALAILGYNASEHTGFASGGATHINVGEVSVSASQAGNNIVHIISGDTKSVAQVYIGRIVVDKGSQTPSSVVKFGPTSEVKVAPTAENCRNIVIDGIEGAQASTTLINFEQSCRDVSIGSLSVSDEASAFTTVIGNTATESQTIERLSVGKVMIPNGAAVKPFMRFEKGVTVIDPVFRNISIYECSSLLSNAATVTNMVMGDVAITKVLTTLINSSKEESGEMMNVHVGTLSGTNYLNVVSKLKFSGSFPTLSKEDKKPKPTIGSIVIADKTNQIDGGGGTTGAIWAGDGTAWNKVAALANL